MSVPGEGAAPQPLLNCKSHEMGTAGDERGIDETGGGGIKQQVIVQNSNLDPALTEKTCPNLSGSMDRIETLRRPHLVQVFSQMSVGSDSDDEAEKLASSRNSGPTFNDLKLDSVSETLDAVN